MKGFFTKIISFLLAIIVVFSTLSFNAVAHFCGDKVVSISYFGENSSCTDEVDTCCAEDNSKSSFTVKQKTCTEDSIEETPCCTDENVFIEGVNTQNHDYKKQLNKEFNLFSNNYTFVTYTYKSRLNKLFTYQSPLITQDIQVELQTFLI